MDKCPVAAARRKGGDRYAYVTFVANKEYVDAACVLIQSQRNVNSSIDFVALVNHGDSDDDSVTPRQQNKLRQCGFNVIGSEKRHAINCEMNLPGNEAVPRYKHVCGKIRAWLLDDLYDVVIFMDADQLVLRNIDALFERLVPGLDFMPFQAPYEYNVTENQDMSLFSSALMILRPSKKQFWEILTFFKGPAKSIDFGDLYKLNAFYGAQIRLQHSLMQYGEKILGSQTWYCPDLVRGGGVYSVFDFSGPLETKPWRVPLADLQKSNIPGYLWELHAKWWRVRHSLKI